MTATPQKPTPAEHRNPGITKKVAIKRTRTSPVKVFLRTVYWLITLAIVGIVLYISFEAGWMIYKNSAH
ncbi:hypothetical protein [Rheinheimera texasensis]|uniref:hypothetical protein n=1 Tax=Rheinheimera texasensis TaxID=306205 RepID=UPI0032B19AF7